MCWYCTSCKTTKSIGVNRFFKLTLQQRFLVCWARDYPVCAAATGAELTEATSYQVYQWLREVCSTTLLQTLFVLRGPGVIVQIDESQFHHKPKVLINILKKAASIIIIILLQHQCILARTSPRCMSFRNSGHITYTCCRFHAVGANERCSNFTSDWGSYSAH